MVAVHARRGGSAGAANKLLVDAPFRDPTTGAANAPLPTPSIRLLWRRDCSTNRAFRPQVSSSGKILCLAAFSAPSSPPCNPSVREHYRFRLLSASYESIDGNVCVG